MSTSISSDALAPFVDDVRRYVRRHVEDPSSQEDLVQEVFVRVHDRRDQLRDEERLAGWIRRIAANVVIDHYRRHRSFDALPAQLADPAALGGASGPDRAILGSWLVQNIGELEPIHREVLVLTELQGLTQREAAGRLGLSLSAVKARVRRGRAALLDRLQRCCHLELDHRGALVGYEPRGGCSTSCCSDPSE